ncbi:hypothetical protein H4219_001375 [Mycoemilia scoparia]|uniref:Uncharacterized protein n=1 Tax=Mycoemilia scoparia TaxID=417184 RepID=A0A9W8A0G0_9FUNG|nr:hypothetical protein H4219_001375 [Mycoemilia scoparia]
MNIVTHLVLLAILLSPSLVEARPLYRGSANINNEGKSDHFDKRQQQQLRPQDTLPDMLELPFSTSNVPEVSPTILSERATTTRTSTTTSSTHHPTPTKSLEGLQTAPDHMPLDRPLNIDHLKKLVLIYIEKMRVTIDAKTKDLISEQVLAYVDENGYPKTDEEIKRLSEYIKQLLRKYKVESQDSLSNGKGLDKSLQDTNSKD